MDQSLMPAPYRNANLTIDDRVDDLLGRMSLDEKIAQAGGLWPRDLSPDATEIESRYGEALQHGIGHISRIGAAGVLSPRESAAVANAFQRFLLEHTRLGIPAIVHEESLAGYTARDATCFPQAIGLASTWNPDLIGEMADVIRRQMRAVGAHQSLAPVLDIARDPRWGRMEETYGEDPYLAARLGVAYVRGLQGADRTKGIAATGKHFIGYGASEGGLNWAPAHIGKRELLEVYAVPFEAAIREAGLMSVMNAYQEIDGVPCGGSGDVLDGLLRQTLGFEGAVVADYFTVRTLHAYHAIAGNEEEAAHRALSAGVDVELPALHYYRALREGIGSGRIDEALLDRSVRRVLRMKFELGLFEQPFVDADTAPAIFDTPDQRLLARRIAEQSIVLLKNDGLLPLARSLRSIAVIGPSANSVRLLQGDYHYPTHVEIIHGAIGEARSGQPEEGEAADVAPGSRGDGIDLSAYFPPMVTLLDGVRNHVGASTEVRYARGCEILGDSREGFREAVDLARGADVVIVAVGERSGLVDGCTSGESSDRAELGLPRVQQDLVEAVIATGTPTVVVLINGRPLAVPWLAEHAQAIVETWVPGEEGGNAIARILFGDVNPSGRLPVTVPRHVGQVPLFYNHKPSGGRSQWRTNYVDAPVSPLFPFGHGLSYTRFEYAHLSVDREDVPVSGEVELSVEITNAGERVGDEVVQLYVHDLVASVTRPVKQLAGFQRLSLEPGETRRVMFRLDLSQLALYDEDMRLVVEPGEVEMMVGASSDDIRVTRRIRVSGERRVLARDEIRPTQSRVV